MWPEQVIAQGEQNWVDSGAKAVILGVEQDICANNHCRTLRPGNALRRSELSLLAGVHWEPG